MKRLVVGIKIILNHLPEEIFEKEQMSIRELLAYKKYSFKLLVIKVNNQLIKNDQYETTFIKEGDDVIVKSKLSFWAEFVGLIFPTVRRVDWRPNHDAVQRRLIDCH